MAYAFVQQNANDNAAAAATITVTLTPTAGNLLVFCVSGDSVDTASIALSDNLGTHNTYSQIGTDLVTAGSQRCAWWFAANCKGGATTFTATFSTTTRFRTVYVAEYSGIATTSPLLNGTRAENVSPGTSADAVSSGNANATSQPALVWGFGIDVDGTTIPNAGTGFTARTGVWSSATSQARPEDKRVTTTGNVAATFTATTGTDGHASGVGVFAETAPAAPALSWSPNFPDRVPARPSISAFGVAVAPVLAIALTPLSWAPSFADRAPARPIPNQATGNATEPVFVPPAAPSVTPMSWSPVYPDQLRRASSAPVVGGSFSPETTLPNPVPSLTSWSPAYPDAIPRSRAALIASGVVEPIAPIPVPSFASWSPDYPDAIPRARGPQILISAAAPTLPIPNTSSSIFPLSVSSDGRHLRQSDGSPFLICADTTWSLAVDIPPAGIDSFLSTITGQGFNAVMMNVIEHHYTVVKPPSNISGNLPFTKRLDGATFTGSPNGTTGTAGTQGQFASDNYSSISTQAADWTFPNNAYWVAVENILDKCLAHNVLVFPWVAYLGFHVNDEGWLNEMVVIDAVIGAGGFTGQPWADNTKSKLWNYGAWLANRWKAYPNLIWVMGGDYGSNTQTLSAPQAAAVSNVMAGMKSVAGQASTFFTAHWDRPALATDTALAAGSFDLNLAYCDESVAELLRRGYAHSPTMPTFIGEYFYENDLFGGTAPYRKYVYWGFLGGVAGGFFGNEQLWRFDDGTPGTDYTTLLTTQATLDAARQFAFWKARPWWRLKPNGLGGIGTLITAGGGTASPQSTDYVAAAATSERDLLLAYVPPDHAGSITVDMTKLGASVTARWFDPTNASFTTIGTFANTGTHAFTTPGSNSAGDADWLLVLEAPDAPMPLSWDPVFPDRAPRLSLTTAQVVSGVVQPVVPPPTPTQANWSPSFPDFTPRARQPVNTGGVTKPEATLPDAPALSWSPSFPDRLTPLAPRPHGGLATPPTDANAGPLTWLSNYPDRVLGPRRAPAGGSFAPPADTNAGPLTWLSNFPDRAPGPSRSTLGGAFTPPPDTNTGPLTWLPRMPDLPGRPRFQPPEGAFVPLPVVPVVPLSWSPNFPDLVLRARQPINIDTSAPLLIIPVVPVVPLSWSPNFPDLVLHARQPINAGGATQPEATLPNTPTPFWSPSFPDRMSPLAQRTHVSGTTAPPTDANAGPLTWLSSFPDRVPGPGRASLGGTFTPPSDANAGPLTWLSCFPDRAPGPSRSPAGGSFTPPTDTNAGPLTWLSQTPSLVSGSRIFPSGGEFSPPPVPGPSAPPLSWMPEFPDRVLLARQPVNAGGMTGPDATIPRPPAPSLSWSPDFPDSVPRARQPINVGGAFASEETLPNPPAPPLSWAPEFPDFALRAVQPINVGGMAEPEATIPNPPAPSLSWMPEFPDFNFRSRQPINMGGMTGPVDRKHARSRTTPPGRAPTQLVGHVATPSIEPRQDEDAHLYGTVRSKRDV